MGCDIHLALERRVMSRKSREALHLLTCGGHDVGDLPTDVMEHIASQFSPDYEWFPVQWEGWLSLSDEEFAEASETYYSAYADSIMSHLDAFIEAKPWMGESNDPPLLHARTCLHYCMGWVVYLSIKVAMKRASTSSEKLSSLFERARLPRSVQRSVEGMFPNGATWHDVVDHDPEEVTYEAEDAAIAAARIGEGERITIGYAALPTISVGTTQRAAVCTALSDRDYDRFGLFSGQLGNVRKYGEPVSQLPCMVEGVPDDAHPAWMMGGGDHHVMHCSLDHLLKTEWDASASVTKTRRDVMGDAIVELETVAEAIGEGLSDYRLIVSFDS